MKTLDSDNKVVVLSKEEATRKAVSSTLGKAGFTIVPASSADDALHLCQGLNPPARLAIVDGDSEFLPRLRRACPAMRVLFMASSEAEESGLRGGRVLHKPFRRAQLLGTVLDVLREPLAFTA